MATTFVFQAYYGGGPTWTTLNSTYNLIGFYGNAYNDKVAVSAFQASTHISGGTGDICLTNHVPNVKYISSNQFSDGTTKTLNDTNLVTGGCTLRGLLTTDAGSSTQNGRFYCYNGSAVETYATGVQVYAFQQGVSGTNWTYINNGSSSAQGGDVVGKRLDFTNQGSSTTHPFYIAVSTSPTSVGAKTSFAFGSTVEYY